MICPNCKKEIADASKFCEFCGTKLGVPNAGQVPPQPNAGQIPPQPNAGQIPPQQNAWQVPPQQNAWQVPPQQAPKKPIDKKKLGMIIGIAGAALVLLIIVIVLIATHKKTIDLEDYTKVTFSGYNGYGKATLNFDNEQFIKDIQEYGKFDRADKKSIENGDWSSVLSSSLDTYNAVNEVSYELNKDRKLSNGDTVKVSFKFDNDAASKIGIKFSGDAKKFKVKGLKKVKKINPFDYLTVSFTGTSPNASIETTVDVSSKDSSVQDAMDYVDFSADHSSGIAKGDKIVITAYADEEYLLEESGCKLEETTKEYTCDKVDEYVMKYADITEDYLGTIKKQAEDVIDAYFAEESEFIKADKITFEGYYFLTNKDVDTWSSHNILDLVYSATVKSKDKSFEKTKVYIPIEFTDVQKYADGQCFVNLDSWERKGSTSLQYDWWKQVTGYTKTDTMYNELVAARKAEYTEECTEKLK